MSDRSRGGQPGNDNAEKHSLFSDREKLYNRLEPHEKEMVVEIATDLLDKYDDDVGAYEREAIRNVAVDVVKRWRYNEHAVSTTHDDSASFSDEHSEFALNAYNRLAKRTTRELEQLGLLEDGPEMKKAEATEDWLDAISNASGEKEQPRGTHSDSGN